jgi:acyl-CoA synthetase (AMP-forming)/AMP-acid ligase II
MTLLHELIDEAAGLWPKGTAVSTGSDELTHRQLADASLRTASWLRAQGVGRGERVVLVGPSSVLVPVLIYAASRVGAPFILLHEQTRGRALEHVLQDAEPALLLAADEQALESARARGIAAASLDDLRARLEAPGRDTSTEATTDAAPLAVAPLAVAPLAVDAVCLIYTSGTTAAPKAVVSTHEQAVFAVRAIQSVLNYRPDDVVYCPLPLSFDYGMYQLFLGAASGARVHLGLPAEVGPSLLRNVVAAGTTVLAAVPAVAHTLARLLRRTPTDLPGLRLLTNTGAAMPAETLADLRAAVPTLRVQLMFGLTECKRAAIMPPDADLDHPGACGLALPGTEVFAADAEGDRLPPGETGELVVRGPNVMAGYWRRPELTAQRFPRQDGLFPRLRTGDHGWLDEQGYVHFVGRLDDIYKERGFRVSSTEVEAAARRIDGVESAAVLPPLDGRAAVLAVVGEVTAHQILLLMREEIEEFKIPGSCVVVPELPLTRNGKVDRKALLAEVSGA